MLKNRRVMGVCGMQRLMTYLLWTNVNIGRIWGSLISPYPPQPAQFLSQAQVSAWVWETAPACFLGLSQAFLWIAAFQLTLPVVDPTILIHESRPVPWRTSLHLQPSSLLDHWRLSSLFSGLSGMTYFWKTYHSLSKGKVPSWVLGVEGNVVDLHRCVSSACMCQPRLRPCQWYEGGDCASCTPTCSQHKAWHFTTAGKVVFYWRIRRPVSRRRK